MAPRGAHRMLACMLCKFRRFVTVRARSLISDTPAIVAEWNSDGWPRYDRPYEIREMPKDDLGAYVQYKC